MIGTSIFVPFSLFAAFFVTEARAGLSTDGDLYVQSEPPGAAILVDGQDTHLVTPSLVRGVAEGVHQVRVRAGCAAAQGMIEVKPRVVARVSLPLVPGTGEVKVSSTPVAAVVAMDGVVVGAAPLDLKGVACGTRSFTFRLADHHDQVATLDVAPWDVKDLAVTLQAMDYGTLVVVPDPIDARILLDGVQAGSGAMTLDRVTAGSHELVVERSGFPTQRRTVVVPKDDVLRLEVSLASAWPAPVVLAPEPKVKKPFPVEKALAVAAVGLGAGFAAHGAVMGVRANEAYDVYMGQWTSVDAAESWYDAEVAPHRTILWIDVGAAVALWGTGAFLGFHPTGD